MCVLLKKECFPFQKGTEGESYIFLEKLGNNRNDGFMQVNVEMEKEILARTNKLVAKWRKDGFNEEDARDFYGEMDKSIIDYYSILCDHANK